MIDEPAWLVEARRYIGQREVKGAQNNPLILKWWAAIRAPFTDDETPWCAGFVGGVLEAVGIKSTRAASARSYCKWGIALDAPELGCVVVFERGPVYGHVGFVVGRDMNGHLMVLGGNQGDAVSIAAFSTARVLAYRWPAAVPIIVSSLPRYAGASGLSRNEA